MQSRYLHPFFCSQFIFPTRRIVKFHTTPLHLFKKKKKYKIHSHKQMTNAWRPISTNISTITTVIFVVFVNNLSARLFITEKKTIFFLLSIYPSHNVKKYEPRETRKKKKNPKKIQNKTNLVHMDIIIMKLKSWQIGISNKICLNNLFAVDKYQHIFFCK